ncbi:porin family protein [Flavobacterium litorale]|uniref:PorT family protein n=1 Tax=Flavobacterium litorale TaxID=2856519 RepID=A0ABX8V5X7_9FLAO|nr:porin family protein [Flavobacterium litorale]QYJ68227.1 PorT family protein [Flavobacterium litorale]
MKKLLFLAVALAGTFAVQAQGINFGVKAGANFSNFSGDVDSEGITSFHAGAVLELNVLPVLSIQGEGLFSSQGAKFENELGTTDVDLSYISVPVMAKYYIIPSKLSLMAGPQFSFLVDEAEESLEANSFDMAAAGGVELKIMGGLFAQARYTIGVTDIADDVDAQNAVFQLSVGYFF